MAIHRGVKLLLDLEEGRTPLPSLSIITVRLIELAAEENCSVKDLVSLIEKDPSLSVRLLTLANSAFFRGRQPVSTLQQAVVRIGLQRLRIMALSLSLRDTFPMGREGAMDFENFWRESLYRGTLARLVSPFVNSSNQEEAFVAALILEIGLLILWSTPLKAELEIPLSIPMTTEDLMTWERTHWGMDHREVGKIALEKWRFPSHITACQDVRSDKECGQISPIETAVDLATRISTHIFSPAKPFHVIYEIAEKHGNIDGNAMNNILYAVFEEVESTASALSLDKEEKKDILTIMDKANTALMQISAAMGLKAADIPSFTTLKEKTAEDGTSVKFAMEAVAHEIRNPLVSVCGFAKKLAAALDTGSEEKKYALVLLKEALRLEKALDQIMSHAKEQ